MVNRQVFFVSQKTVLSYVSDDKRKDEMAARNARSSTIHKQLCAAREDRLRYYQGIVAVAIQNRIAIQKQIVAATAATAAAFAVASATPAAAAVAADTATAAASAAADAVAAADAAAAAAPVAAADPVAAAATAAIPATAQGAASTAIPHAASAAPAAALPAAAPVDNALMDDAPADDVPTAAAAAAPAASSLSPAMPASVGCPPPLLDIHTVPRLWALWTVGLGAVQQPLERFAGRAPGGMQRYSVFMCFRFLSFETLLSCLSIL